MRVIARKPMATEPRVDLLESVAPLSAVIRFIRLAISTGQFEYAEDVVLALRDIDCWQEEWRHANGKGLS
jgi:hypothetical protein